MARNHCLNLKEALAKTPLFEGVAPKHLEKISAASRFVRLRKGGSIVRVGDSAKELFLIWSGAVKRSMLSYDGHEKVLALLSPGKIFGETELFGSRPYASFAVAVEPTELLCIDGNELRSVLERDPRLALRLVASLADRQFDVECEIAESFFQPGNQRVLDYFLREAGPRPEPALETRIFLPASKQLVASRIGITPETLSRALRDLTEAGLIVVDGRYVTLRNGLIANRPIKTGQGNPATMPARKRLQALATGAAGDMNLRERRNRAWTAAAINKAGLQRMLSQRMAKSWLMLGRDLLPILARSTLHQSVELFDKHMTELASAAINDEVREAQVVLGEAWRPYRILLAATPNAASAHELFELSEKVLAAAHTLTLAFEQVAGTAAARRINLAGRERMLSQRMAKFYLFRQWNVNVDQCQAELEKARQEFSSALIELTAEPDNTPLIATELDLVSEQWGLMQSALTSQDDSDVRRATTNVVATSDRVLEKMDSAVGLYEKLAT